MMFYCLISPNNSAKTFLRPASIFFTNSGSSSSTDHMSTPFFPGSESFAPVMSAITPANPFLAPSTFLTVELALLTPETELDASEAGKIKIKCRLFYRNVANLMML